MNEMKPCPICKREHEIDIDAEFGGVMFRHKNFDWNKDQCLLAEQELSENVSVNRFVEIWNSRPIEDQLKSENDKLRAENERLREALREIAEDNSYREDTDNEVGWHIDNALKVHLQIRSIVTTWKNMEITVPHEKVIWKTF